LATASSGAVQLPQLISHSINLNANRIPPADLTSEYTGW